MDIEYLRNLRSPCILHMVNDDGTGHYQVCFGATKRWGRNYYLMADPSKFIYYLSEGELDIQWKSKSALYFEGLIQTERYFSPHWASLLSEEFFPIIIWLVVPVLAICVSFLGVAFSWLLQRGIDDPLAEKRASLFFAIVALLLIIMLFRSVLSYLKQRIQIALNLAVNNRLYAGLLQELFKAGAFLGGDDDTAINKAIVEIQKIQSAINAFIAVLLSDGLLLLFIVIGTFCWLPVAGLVNVLFITVVIGITFFFLPAFAYDYAHLNALSGGFENVLKTRCRLNNPNKSGYSDNGLHAGERHQQYLRFSKRIAVKISRINLFYDCLATINVILVFVIGLMKVKQNEIAYPTCMLLVILSFIASTLITRICNTCYVISDGAEAFKQFKSNLSD